MTTTDQPAYIPTKQLAKGAEDLRAVHEVQARHGNWNFSPYMHGMFAGLELALALTEGREPQQRDKPEQYLCDLPEPTACEPGNNTEPAQP